MKRLITLAALIATPAYADGFTNREIAYQALNAADGVQTCLLVRSGHIEGNPLLGRNPSCAKVAGFKIAGGLIHYAIADHLRDRDPKAAKVFQIVSLVIQGGVVAANMRFVF